MMKKIWRLLKHLGLNKEEAEFSGILASSPSEIQSLFSEDDQEVKGQPGGRDRNDSAKDSTGGRDRNCSAQDPPGGRGRNYSTRLRQLESQGTILIQSVDHLFSEVANLQEDHEELRQELAELGQGVRAAHDSLQPSLLRLTKSVDKLTKFFGEDPALIRLILDHLGCVEQAGLLEETYMGLLQLRPLSGESVEDHGHTPGSSIQDHGHTSGSSIQDHGHTSGSSI